MRARILISVLAAGALSGCLEYNDPCGGLVADRTAVVAKIDADIYVDKPNARHANNAIGRLGAEAFLHAFDGTDSPKVDFAFFNGGAIRAEGGVLGPDGQCVTRNILKAGELTNGDLHQILLFENLVYSVTLREDEMFAALENAYGGLSPVGEAISSPPGRFLDVAGGKVVVDCAQPAGQRVVSITVGEGAGARTLSRNGTGKVRVAMPEYLLAGNDGFTMLAGLRDDVSPERDYGPVQAQREGGIDNDIVAAWAKAHYLQTPFPVHPEDANDCGGEGASAANCDSPVLLLNCAVPGRPR